MGIRLQAKGISTTQLGPTVNAYTAVFVFASEAKQQTAIDTTEMLLCYETLVLRGKIEQVLASR